MAIDYVLMCDRCGRCIDGSRFGAADVRRVTKAEGQARRIEGKDICSRCESAARDRSQDGEV